MNYMAIGVGTTGNAYIHHLGTEDATFNSGTIHPEFTNPPHLSEEILTRFEKWPIEEVPNNRRFSLAMDIFTEYVLKEKNPEVALIWSSEPDKSQHAYGVGHPLSDKALSEADQEFGKLLGYIESRPDKSDIDIMILSDHGYSTVMGKIDVKKEMEDAGFNDDLSEVVNKFQSKIEEDELIKKGFDPKSYVEKIWDSKIIPTIKNDSEQLTLILDELFKNKEITEEKYGGRSGTGSYSFMIKGKGEVISLNTASRVGTLSIKLEKQYDSEIFITLGPVIKKDSIRDAVKFIKFNDFVNQLDFADVSRIIKVRVLNEIIGPLNLKEITGKNINFEGAITFDRKDKIYITPTKIEFIN